MLEKSFMMDSASSLAEPLSLPPVGPLGPASLYQRLADALEQLAWAAERLAGGNGHPSRPGVAMDAAVLCRAASEIVSRGSALSLETARLAIASVVKLRSNCEIRITDDPCDDPALACINYCGRCEEAYLAAYLHERGFSTAP